jgi:hypothetical protein
LAKGGKIRRRIDQDLDAVATGDPPTGSPSIENGAAVEGLAVVPRIRATEERLP